MGATATAVTGMIQLPQLKGRVAWADTIPVGFSLMISERISDRHSDVVTEVSSALPGWNQPTQILQHV